MLNTQDILRELIKYNTYKDKENKQIMNYIEKVLKEVGFKTDYKSKCLIMSIKQKSNLGFLGHTDTVKSGDNWKSNPLELKNIDGKLFGLGTCDMKGSIAAILKACIDTDWKKYKKGIKLYFTYDEEIGFEGVKEINKLNYKFPENMIIGEPTYNKVMNGSKGLLELKFTFNGKSAHSSNPSKGINAIEKCINFLSDIKDFYNKLKEEQNKYFQISYTTMNIGKIEGGQSINIVPDKATVYIDFRVISNNHIMQILEEVEKLQTKYEYTYEIINNIKPFITKAKNVITTNFITEASLIECENKYILGVGPINPHEANEYITIESLEELVKQYKSAIEKFCI